MARIVGIDIGGSGVKGATVETRTGQFLTTRERIETPRPALPDAVAAVVAEIVGSEGGRGAVGITFPGVVQAGVVRTAANLDASWQDVDAVALFSEACRRRVTVLNDADAAGIAEVRFGAAKGVAGTVLMLTFGTGIGSALLRDGVLVPNTELGHLELDGRDAEKRASSAAKDRKGLSWKQWARRVSTYLQYVEGLLAPDLFIVGGGVSRKFDKWGPSLECRTPVVPGALQNSAGIVGAAIAAAPPPRSRSTASPSGGTARRAPRSPRRSTP